MLTLKFLMLHQSLIHSTCHDHVQKLFSANRLSTKITSLLLCVHFCKFSVGTLDSLQDYHSSYCFKSSSESWLLFEGDHSLEIIRYLTYRRLFDSAELVRISKIDNCHFSRGMFLNSYCLDSFYQSVNTQQLPT